MPNLAANLSMLFGEVDFLDRFEAASKAGFTAVEYLFPYDYSADEINQKLKANGLEQALFNAPPGDWDKGERGIACLPGRQEEFKAGIKKALEYVSVIGNERLHVMAGILDDSADPQLAADTYIQNIKYAAQEADKQGVTILIEPINFIDIPGYFLNYQEEGVDFIEQIDEENVRLQFDFYHCQMMQGNVVTTFKALQPFIDHVQIAGVPDRHEPDVGEMNYAFILEQLDASGYKGFVGCEYKPKADTLSGLGWMSSLIKVA